MLTNALYFLRKHALVVTLLFIPVFSAVMHWRVFPTELVGAHAWRQVQTQVVVVNFYEEDFNILNPRVDSRGSHDGILRREFPIMQWLFACVYKLFGNQLVITRILSFLMGICTLAGMYFLVKNLFKDRLAAVVGAWALCFSPAFFYYTVNPLPDNFALCCAVWGTAFFFRWHTHRVFADLLWTGFFLSLSALAKLPFVIYCCAPFLCFLIEFLKKKEFAPFAGRTLTMALLLAPAAAWYAWVIPDWSGTGIVAGMLENETPMAVILKYLWGNLISVLPEMLLNYASLPFFLAGGYFLFVRKLYRDARFVLLAAVGVAALAYFLFEINMIALAHDYYLFPFMPLLFILVSYGALQMLTGKNVFLARTAIFLLLLAPVTAFLRTQKSWNTESPGFNKDLLTYKRELREAVPQDALCVAGNDVSRHIFLYYIDKKGWAFDSDRIDRGGLEYMIGEGAQYLYSDTRRVDEGAEFRPLLDSLILEKGTIRVFRLRK